MNRDAHEKQLNKLITEFIEKVCTLDKLAGRQTTIISSIKPSAKDKWITSASTVGPEDR